MCNHILTSGDRECLIHEEHNICDGNALCEDSKQVVSYRYIGIPIPIGTIYSVQAESLCLPLRVYDEFKP